ncbi:LysR family transcriptional regulator [Thermus scotoductus]|uniref:LysR family transcriptional regulator n=1 Tax=Thermus scotoductus TaxID=37636 RepID=A0A430UEI6_THESC|nr:LysR family transcriptional regulator [Thermus scotoductus]RTH00462.1 LysR family transcriptional regulator [Thermus scotoductus]RTH97462.1 LysR family transcriptional regulator [Thermus scotoductus]RTI11310.1 LysR family transcriptional regulator [Thermus scotoductus]
MLIFKSAKLPNPAALRVFVTVVEEGGVGRAALALGITQPAVSQYLRALEEQVGHPLFERQGRHLVLSRVGQALLPEARRVVQALEEFQRVSQAMGRLELGEVTLGAATTMATYVLPLFLKKFHEAHPGVRVHVESGSSERLAERLRLGELELAVLEGVERWEGYERHLFYEDELVLIVPPEHPWAAREAVPPEWLREETLVVRKPGSMTWRALERAFEQAGLELNPIFYTDNNEVTKRLVLAGAGVGIVSRVVVQPNLKVGNLRALRLAAPVGEIRRYFWLVHPKNVANPAARALISLLRS